MRLCPITGYINCKLLVFIGFNNKGANMNRTQKLVGRASTLAMPALEFLGFAMVLAIIFYAPDAMAAGGLEGKGHGALEFVSKRLGPIIVGFGVVGGAITMIAGIPGAMQKVVFVVIGGIMLTSVDSIVGIIQGL